MKLSDNFYLSEFLRSRSAIENDYKEQFNPPVHVIDNLLKLVQNVLRPVRTRFDDRIYVTSGYRCKRVNTDVGGVCNSDHLTGMAADVTCKDLEALWMLITAMDLPFKQMIWYMDRNFIHISFDECNHSKTKWRV